MRHRCGGTLDAATPISSRSVFVDGQSRATVRRAHTFERHRQSTLALYTHCRSCGAHFDAGKRGTHQTRPLGESASLFIQHATSSSRKFPHDA